MLARDMGVKVILVGPDHELPLEHLNTLIVPDVPVAES
jgi:hypothetical protein